METYCEGKIDDDLARVKECAHWCTFSFLSFGLVVTKEVLNFGLKDLDIDLEMPGT
jgi:hypothetical protein